MALSYSEVKQALDAANADTGGKFVAFNTAFYLANYSVVRDANGAIIDNSLSSFAGDPLQHYVEQGAAKGYMPNAWFDPVFYRSTYADVAPLAAGDLIAHYALHGVNEGRAPNQALQSFNGERYLADNADVLPYVEANLDDFGGSLTNGALAHYLKFGAAELRPAYNMAGTAIQLVPAPAQSTIAGTTDGDVTTVSLDTNGGQTLLTGSKVVIDGGTAGTSTLRLVGDADVRIDFTNPANQVKGIDLNGDGVIAANGVENNISAAGIATFKNFDIVDAYARNPLNLGDHSQNFLGNIAFDGTGFQGDGVSTDGNIFLGGLGADVALGGIGNDFLAGGGVVAGQDNLSGGRNADFFFTELSLLDNTDGDNLRVDGGTTADDTSAGVGQSAQDSDWLLLEASDDDEPVQVILEDTNLGDEFDGDFIVGNGRVVSNFVAVNNLIDIENVDASGNLYGFLDGVDVSIGGGGHVVNGENVGIGSSAQLDILGSSAGNIIIGGFDNDHIDGQGGNDLIMGGNLNYLNNPNLLQITNDGRDEMFGGAGNDNIVFEADGGIIDGGANDDTLWLTRESLGTKNAADMTKDGVLRFELQNGDNGDGLNWWVGYGGADVEGTADQTNYKANSSRVTLTNMESVIATGLGAIDYKAAGSNNPDLNFNNQQNFFGYEGDLDLRGTGGANTLYANTGDDVLEGREGKDNLSGGDGSDDFLFQLLENGGDGVDVIHRQTDANNDNLWDGTFGRDFDLGGVQTQFDSTFTLHLPGVLAQYFDGVRFSLGGTTYELTGLAAANPATWAANLTAKLAATPGLTTLEVDSDGAGQIVLTDPDGRAFAELANGWVLVNGQLPPDGADDWSQSVGAPQTDATQDRLIYVAYEDRSDNERVDDDSVQGSTISLGADSYAEDLVVHFAADGTRLAEEQRYTIEFNNLTTEDIVTITINGVNYRLQVGIDLDGNIIAAEDGVGDNQVAIQTAFLGRLNQFINSFMDDDTAVGAVDSAFDGNKTLTITQRLYNGEETVFMTTPTVAVDQKSGGEKATWKVANISDHEVWLTDYKASSLNGQLTRSLAGNGVDPAALDADNVLFIGNTDINRAVLQTALDAGQTVTGDEAVLIDSGANTLESAVRTTGAQIADNKATNAPLTGQDWSVHGDDLLIGGSGTDTILGGTGDDRVIGSLGADIADGGKNFYAVKILGEAQARVYVLNVWEAANVKTAIPDLVPLTVSSVTLINQSESGQGLVSGLFDDTLQFQQADFSPGNSRFYVTLNDFNVTAGGVVELRHGGAGTVKVDVQGDGTYESTTTFTNFENIRTVSGIADAVAGNGQGNDTLDVAQMTESTGGIMYNLTNNNFYGATAGEVRYSVDALSALDANNKHSVGGDYESLVIRVDGVENFITNDNDPFGGNDLLLIDETEAAKDNLFDAGVGVDRIEYHNNYALGNAIAAEPVVTIYVGTGADQDKVVMTGGRLGGVVATDTLNSVEFITLLENTAEGAAERDVVDVTAFTGGATVDYTNGKVSTAGGTQLTIENISRMEIVRADGNDTVIVADGTNLMSAANARSDAAAADLQLMTYIDYDTFDAGDKRIPFANQTPAQIEDARNFGQYTFDLSYVGTDQDVDRVDYHNADDQIVAVVDLDPTVNKEYVLVNVGATADATLFDDANDRVDALISVEQVVASQGESVLDFTGAGKDVTIRYSKVLDGVDRADIDSTETYVRIGLGTSNVSTPFNNRTYVELYDNNTPADNTGVTAVWNRIEGSDKAEYVELTADQNPVNHTFNLRGGANEVNYNELQSTGIRLSVQGIVNGTTLVNIKATDNTGAITTTGDLDNDGIVDAGEVWNGFDRISSYNSENKTTQGSLRVEASQSNHDSIDFRSLQEATLILLGEREGLDDKIEVYFGQTLDSVNLTLTGFEALYDSGQNDVYQVRDLSNFLSTLALIDNAAADFDTLALTDGALESSNGVVWNDKSIELDSIEVAIDVLNGALGGPFDFKRLDVSQVTKQIDYVVTLDANESVVLGSLNAFGNAADAQVDVQGFAAIEFTSTDGMGTNVVVDLDLGEFRQGDGTVLFTFDAATTFDFSAIEDDMTVTVVDVGGVGATIITDGEDTITGDRGPDTITGGAHADVMDGGFVPEVAEVHSYSLNGTTSATQNGVTVTVDLTAGQFGAGTADGAFLIGGLVLVEGAVGSFADGATAAQVEAAYAAQAPGAFAPAAGTVTNVALSGGALVFTFAETDPALVDLGPLFVVPGTDPFVTAFAGSLVETANPGNVVVSFNGVTLTEGVDFAAGADADAIGSLFASAAFRDGNLVNGEFNNAADMADVDWDALANELVITFTSAAGDVADNVLGALAVTLNGDPSPLPLTAGAESVDTPYAPQGESVDTFVFAEGDSTEDAMDQILNFSVGAVDDIIDVSAIEPMHSSHAFNVNNGGSAFADYAAVKAAAEASISNFDFYPFVGSDGTDTWVFFDDDHNGTFDTETDTVIKLVGIDATGIDANNFVF